MTPSAAAPLDLAFLDAAPLPEIAAILERTRSPFAVHSAVANAVAHLVVQERRTRVLEFGAGTSSLVLATAMRRIGGGTLTSVEQSPEWCAAVWAEVAAVPTVDARLVQSGLHLAVDGRGPYYRYDVEAAAVADRGPFDLAFVDAPESLLYGRDGPLHWCIAHLAPGALVVLDDARRRRERRSVRRWLQTYPGLELLVDRRDVGRGIAVLRYDGGGRARTSPAVLASGTYDYVRMLLARARHRRAR